jgi:hypothetical protein
LEKKEPAPEETKVVAEPQEVPERETDEETLGATDDLSRDLRLAVGYRGQLRTRTKRDGLVRQEYAAVGRPTLRTVPATGKGGLRKGPGKKCRVPWESEPIIAVLAGASSNSEYSQFGVSDGKGCHKSWLCFNIRKVSVKVLANIKQFQANTLLFKILQF